ncbi:MAG TPA: hypothetical protein VFO18_02530 [Methylomirabilota bacterium]|nr:hypothetical protein [Methylomirabilota bacterium]
MTRAIVLLLALAVPGTVWAQPDGDIALDIARLRSLLAASAAQEQQCLAGATRTVWAGATAKDLQQLKERARQMQERALRGASAGGDARTVEAWQALQQKAERLEAMAVANTRSGADLLATQAVGMDCLDRFAGEREALRASLEQALSDPAAYKASLRDARLNGSASLRRDVNVLQAGALGLAARLRTQAAFDQVAGEAAALSRQADDLRQRHVAALESEPNRAIAGPMLRAAELLVGTVSAWRDERAAGDSAAREEAARLKQRRWGDALQLLGEAARAAN